MAASMVPGSVHSAPPMVTTQRMQQVVQPSRAMLPSHVTLRTVAFCCFGMVHVMMVVLVRLELSGAWVVHWIQLGKKVLSAGGDGRAEGGGGGGGRYDAESPLFSHSFYWIIY